MATASTTTLLNQSYRYGGGSEEKKAKIGKVGVGQGRRGAMLSTQSEAID
jgi:hypothetical protein